VRGVGYLLIVERTGIAVAVGPAEEAWAVDAIRAGGGRPVRLDQAGPRGGQFGLVWTDARAVGELGDVLRAHPQISWVQLPMAGIERVAEAGLLDDRRQWTSAKGAYAEPCAEHALALLLAGLRHLPERARAHSWGKTAGLSLFDQPVTIVGGGGIATALVRLLVPFRARVTIVRRRPEPVAGAITTVGPTRLHEALTGARGVVLALALTPENRGLISRKELAVMDEHAWLVNVARGGLVDTDALVEALRSRSIAGAALDVTDPEPLPADHPLWDLPNCLITPHTADTPEMTRPMLARRVAENVQRLTNGQELEGRVDPKLGY
jgi:phosphoglycerate dehydrogenase-like enzyme